MILTTEQKMTWKSSRNKTALNMEHIDISNLYLATLGAEIFRFVIRTTDLKDPVLVLLCHSDPIVNQFECLADAIVYLMNTRSHHYLDQCK